MGPFKIFGKRGDLAYQLELPSNFTNVHDVFHVSQLRKCFKTPERTINFEEIDLQEDLSYHEHPIAILEETERKTRNKYIKFLKVSGHIIPTVKPPGNARTTSVLNIWSFSTPRSRDEILS